MLFFLSSSRECFEDSGTEGEWIMMSFYLWVNFTKSLIDRFLNYSHQPENSITNFRNKWTNLPRTMANICVAFFSFCWEIFLLLMVFTEVWVFPLGKACVWKALATTGAESSRAPLAGSPFFSAFWPSSGGVGGLEVGLALALLGINSWWLVAGVSPRAHCGCCFCFWLLPLLFSSSSSRSSPSLTPSLMNIWARSQKHRFSFFLSFR